MPHHLPVQQALTLTDIEMQEQLPILKTGSKVNPSCLIISVPEPAWQHYRRLNDTKSTYSIMAN